MPGGMLDGSKALAPSRIATALGVTVMRSAPCGGSGSWAMAMRTGHQVNGPAATLLPVISRPS